MSSSRSHRGEAIFMQRCTGCHGRKADGNGPNSHRYFSATAQSAQLGVYQQASRDHRLFESIEYGVEGTAMPSWMDYGLHKTMLATS